jgi:flagellar biosynthesis protein FliR
MTYSVQWIDTRGQWRSVGFGSHFIETTVRIELVVALSYICAPYLRHIVKKTAWPVTHDGLYLLIFRMWDIGMIDGGVMRVSMRQFK